MKILEAFKNIVTGLLRSLKRFPVTILFSISVCIMLITISEIEPIYDENLRDILIRTTMIFALGIPLSLCIKLFLERKHAKKLPELVKYYGGGALILILYYSFLLNELNMVSITRYAAVTLALYLGFLYIPYLPKKKRFEMYIIKICTSFFTTVIYSVVLFLGLTAILFTVDNLLGIHIEEKAYYYTWLLVVCIFAPSYFLTGVPDKDERFTKESYSKLLRILILYIVMPLLSVYTCILYIYFIKIIVTRQWPVGMVSHLVLWYSVIVAAVLFFIAPIRDTNKWADRFSKWFPKIIIPVLIMMFISMGIRINAYGVTENRYYVIVLGLWVFGIMVYLSLVKNPKNIVLPVVLSAIAIVSVFGPLSSYSISKMSQNNRLGKILIRNNMVMNGGVQAAPDNISSEDKDEVSRILDYFSRNHTLDDVRCLPEGFKIEDMEKVFGFSYESPSYGTSGDYFYFSRDNTGKAIEVDGYDYMLDIEDLYNTSEIPEGEIGAVYDHQSCIIKVSIGGNIVYEKDLKPFVKKLGEKYKGTARENAIPAEEMMLVDENEELKVKFIFTHISGENLAGNARINSLDFYMLVKVK
ncbi:MAG: DUF4153 domain-containing protein [Clostridia bacterium]|nr:DUF4153 domain-containing protein [Clostridia bacterium]